MYKKLHMSQSGIAHMALVLVLVLTAVGGAGYYVWNKQIKSDSSTSTQTATQKQVAIECKKQIDDKDFCKFASNWNLNDSYKITATSDGSSNSSWVFEGNKDSSHMVLTDNGAVLMETISIGNATYTKNVGTNSWTKSVSDSNEVEEETGLNVEDITSENVKYEKVGKEACGSLNCFKYKIVETDNLAAEQYLWFDDSDYKLRKYTSTEEGETSTMVISYENVNISVPSPVVE